MSGSQKTCLFQAEHIRVETDQFGIPGEKYACGKDPAEDIRRGFVEAAPDFCFT